MREKGEDVQFEGNMFQSEYRGVRHSNKYPTCWGFAFDDSVVQNCTDVDRHYDRGESWCEEIPYCTFIEQGCVLNQDQLHYLMMAQPDCLIQKYDVTRFDRFVSILPGHWVKMGDEFDTHLNSRLYKIAL